MYLKYSNIKANKVIKQNDNSNPELFTPGHNTLALVVKNVPIDLQKQDKIWYLDYKRSQHFCKNRVIFKDF